MIDVIVKPNASKTTKSMLALALNGVRGANIIEARSFQEGLRKAHNEFVCYIGNGIVNDGFFRDNLPIFTEQVSFKKLAMVGSCTTNANLTKKIYGFLLTKEGIVPVENMSSSQPYGIQIGFIPGAIIRRSAIESMIDYLQGKPLQDSYQSSIGFWLTGKRCYINPSSLYIDSDFNDIESIKFIEDPWQDHEEMQKVKDMWRREVIG